MIKEVVELEVKGTGKGIKQVDKLGKSVKKVKKETDKATKSSKEMGGTLDKVSGGAINKFSGMIKSVKSLAGGFNILKIAIIGTGIGLLLIAILAVKTAFTASEAGQNKFAKLMGIIGSVVGNVVDVIADLGEFIIDLFSGDGEAVSKLKSFGKAIFDVIGLPIKIVIEEVKTLGKVLGALFSGDISGAFDALKQGAENIKDDFKEAGDTIKGAKDALVNFGKEIVDDAKKQGIIEDKRAKAIKLQRKLTVESSQADQDIADLRFKSEQRTKFTAKESVEFLKQASKISEDITNQEIEVAKLKFDALVLENTLSKSTIEDKDKEAQLESDLIQLTTKKLNLQKRLQTSIITFQNQVRTGEKASEKARLDKRKKELKEFQEDADKIKKIKTDQDKKDEEVQAEKELKETERLESIKAIQDGFKTRREDEEANTEILKAELELERQLARLTALQEGFDAESAVFLAAEAQKQLIIEESNTKIGELNKAAREKQSADEIEDAQILAQTKLAIKQQGLNDLIFIAGEESKIGKALLTVKQLLNAQELILDISRTIAFSKQALSRSLIAVAEGTANTAKIGFPQNIPMLIGYVAQAVGIISAIKSATSKSGASTGGIGLSTSISTPSISAPPILTPSFSEQPNALAEAIRAQTQDTVIRAFVVSGDMSTSQELERNIIQSSSLG